MVSLSYVNSLDLGLKTKVRFSQKTQNLQTLIHIDQRLKLKSIVLKSNRQLQWKYNATTWGIRWNVFSFVGKTCQNNDSMTQLSHDKYILVKLVQR
jgi:hypothetical protein